ncbi:MAG: hypothetical protein V2I54_08645 [Bacteroidales bacterium]|jgi:hypothetical protein|nr:hypothetical protein [Bacteroidales bacterium]
MKNYRSIILTFFLILGIIPLTSAQINKLGGGLTLAMGNNIEYEGLEYTNNSLGLNLRGNYKLNKKMDLVPHLNFYLPQKIEFTLGGESTTTVFALNIDIHYILNYRSRNDFYAYLLGGFHGSGWNINDDHISSIEGPIKHQKFLLIPGANLGGGIQFKAGSRTEIFAEAKYILSEAHQLVFTPGIWYHF